MNRGMFARHFGPSGTHRRPSWIGVCFARHFGLSGTHPGLMREFVVVGDRRMASLFLAAVGRFVRTGVAGELCDRPRGWWDLVWWL